MCIFFDINTNFSQTLRPIPTIFQPFKERWSQAEHSSIVTQKQKEKQYELDRLRGRYDNRRTSDRPMPACVAKAYRKLIDQKQITP